MPWLLHATSLAPWSACRAFPDALAISSREHCWGSAVAVAPVAERASPSALLPTTPTTRRDASQVPLRNRDWIDASRHCAREAVLQCTPPPPCTEPLPLSDLTTRQTGSRSCIFLNLVRLCHLLTPTYQSPLVVPHLPLSLTGGSLTRLCLPLDIEPAFPGRQQGTSGSVAACGGFSLGV